MDIMNGVYHVMDVILPLPSLQFSFMKNAFLAILLLTPLLGLLGTMAVNQQMAFFSDALGHSALTGIGLGMILGIGNDLVSMLIFGILWAVLISLIRHTGSASADTVISVFSSTSVAAGLLILSRGGGFAKYSSLLIGDILAVTRMDILYLLIALVVGVTLWMIMYNGLLEFRRVLFRSHAALSVLFALISGMAGLFSSYSWNTSAGAAIILYAAAIYAVSLMLRGKVRG